MEKKYFIHVVEVVLSLLIVCSLFWVAFFVTPVVQVKKIERFPFERRDLFFSAQSLDEQGQAVCVVGSYGKIIRTGDGGATWEIQETPVRTHLQKVVAWDAQSLLAIGDKGTVLVTRNAGRDWTRVDVPSYQFGDQLLSAEIDPESGRAWVVGSMGTVLVSEDRGDTWRMSHPPEDVSWNNLTIAPGGTMWIVGEFGAVKYSRDNGASWELAAVPTEASLNAIDFSDETHGVIVGLSGTILATSDGGQNWQLVETEARSHLFGLLWDGSSYHAIGDAGMILSSDALGIEWKVGKLAPQNFGWYTGITRAGNSYFISGAGAGVYSEGDWKPFEPGQRNYKQGSNNNG
ncbi:MAG: glycosyl hydrolase [Desulfuromonadales bacterium]|nr:glycosyl hydrolase [Desulfuromonadales bacterium]